MKKVVRKHLGVLTAFLTVVSLLLIVGAVRGFLPVEFLPRAPAGVLTAIPAANAVLSVTAIGTILLGVRAIHNGNVRRHRALMLGAFGLFVIFLVLYLYRVSLVGPTHFAGPDWVATFVYLPILVVHMGLAIVCLPLLYYVLLLAYTHSVSELPTTLHPRIGRVATVLWLISFTLGVIVFFMLYVVY